MFTPAGYLSWEETVNAASDWTLEITAASLAPELTIDQLDKDPCECSQLLHERLVSTERVENRNEAHFAMSLLELWVLANFMDTYDAVLCSPDGRTLRCPPVIKAHGDAFDWWLWPLSHEKMSNGEAHGYFNGFRSRKFSIEDAQERFCALDYATGTIRLKPNTERLLFTSSYGHGFSEEDIKRLIDEQMRPIVGWSICWDENSIPKTKKELFESLGFRDLDWWVTRKSETKGRSLSSPESFVFKCIMTAFPDGKGEATWSDVQAKVGYSRRSIIRALKQNGVHSEWARSGQTK